MPDSNHDMSVVFSNPSPARTDTRWTRWAKILTEYQSLPGALPQNDARLSDTLRTLKNKVLAAILGIPACWCAGETVCVNVIPEGAVYQILGPAEYAVTVLSPNTDYKLIAGANEASYQNEGGADTPLINGQVVFFTSGPTPTFSLFGLLGNSPVTATICTA